jgi:hypothetical protein
MAITYATKILSLEKKDVNDLNSVVVKIYWTLTGTNENGISADYAAWTDITLDTSSEFVPFNSLTMNQVIAWIPSYHIENAKPVVEERIALQVNPAIFVVEADLPWNKE